MNDEEALERLREICLAFPEAYEDAGVGDPTWKVNEKLFALRHSLHGERRWSMWCKAPPGAQELLAFGAPERFFVPRTSATTAGSARTSTSSRTGTSSPT